jgi:hypothetical protein
MGQEMSGRNFACANVGATLAVALRLNSQVVFCGFGSNVLHLDAMGDREVGNHGGLPTTNAKNRGVVNCNTTLYRC